MNYSSLLRNKSYINGEWVSASDASTFQVKNPYNQEVISEVADCTIEEVTMAIKAANEAFGGWKALTAGDRSNLLKQWHQLVVKHSEGLAHLLTSEQGKPISEALGEIKYGASFIEWFAEEAKRVYGDVIPGHQTDKRILVIKQPVGPVAAITPWNFPVAMITRKVAPALAAGCPVVIKPSELTPLSALALAELADQAGFPPGVFNVIATSRAKETGELFCNSSLIKKISFTGSTRVGKLLLSQSAPYVKRVSLELGGNAPFIVFDDADIEEAVQGAIAAKYRNAGQTCVCANRIFVHRPIYETFVNQFIEASEKLQVGNGLDNGVDIGPLINERALKFVEDLIEDAKAKGCTITASSKKESSSSLIHSPTVISNANRNIKAFDAEIFGPIAPIFAFEDEEQAITLANDTSYGLAAYFYGKDHARIWRVAEALQYGMVGINTGMISTPVAPFGGIKESGMGREGSKYGLDDFLDIKYMCWGGL